MNFLIDCTAQRYIRFFDFMGAFSYIRMYPKDEHMTEFRARKRKLEYTCMPFGLVNATAELHMQVNRNFPGPPNEDWVGIYMDDVLVFR